MLTLRNKYPSRGQYQTEHSGGTWVSDQVKGDFEEITHVMRTWGRAYVKWGLALDQNRGPHAGGCGTYTPLVTVNTSGAISYPIEFYTLGHFSRFVMNGARRVHSTNASGVISVAFVNPDGSKALVAYNDTRTGKTFQVRWGTKTFSYTLAGFAGATFTWSGVQDVVATTDARVQMQASSFTSAVGVQTEGCTDTTGGFDVGFTDNGDYAVYPGVNFGTDLTAVEVRVAGAGKGGTAEFHLDAVSGPVVATVTIPVTGGWQKWTTVSGSGSGVSGTHDLYVVFRGTTDIGNVNWFRFR